MWLRDATTELVETLYLVSSMEIYLYKSPKVVTVSIPYFVL